MQEIDWEQIWADKFEYGRNVAEALHGLITPESKALDIGAGPGSLLIPFAEKVRKVTAVEPAVGMIECLEKNAKQKGLGTTLGEGIKK